MRRLFTGKQITDSGLRGWEDEHRTQSWGAGVIMTGSLGSARPARCGDLPLEDGAGEAWKELLPAA